MCILCYLASEQTFTEIPHGLGQYPDMVTVRTMLDNGFMSDGQGNHYNTNVFVFFHWKNIDFCKNKLWNTNNHGFIVYGAISSTKTDIASEINIICQNIVETDTTLHFLPIL